MIVRDEQEFIAGCLESAALVVDEILVVDTGSTDRTVEIAETFGARVERFAWCDDFAAARNAALEVAAGDFVLWLDADEQLTEPSGRVLRQIVQGEPVNAPPTVYLPLIVSVDRAGQTIGADHMARLWRRRSELSFSGRVHEEVGVGLHGLKRHVVDALEIRHFGYDSEVIQSRAKHARNQRLLEADLAERPDDPRLLYYLAKERYSVGDDAEALSLFERVIDDGGIVNLALSAHVFACECLRALGRAEEAMQLALAGTRRSPDYGELWYVAAQAALEAGRPIQAEAQFARAAARPTGVAALAFRDPTVAAWRADAGRGAALLRQGHAAEALGVLRETRLRVPSGADRIALELDLVDAALAIGEQAEAWTVLEPLLDDAPADAVSPLLVLVNLYVEVMGLAAAYGFIEDCLAVHPTMADRLEPVAAAAELAGALGDDAHQLRWLQRCARLESPIVQHYVDLSRLLIDQGALGAAEAAARAAQRLLEGVSTGEN